MIKHVFYHFLIRTYMPVPYVRTYSDITVENGRCVSIIFFTQNYPLSKIQKFGTSYAERFMCVLCGLVFTRRSHNNAEKFNSLIGTAGYSLYRGCDNTFIAHFSGVSPLLSS